MLKLIAYLTGLLSLSLTSAVIYQAYKEPAGSQEPYLFFAAVVALLVSYLAGERAKKQAGSGQAVLDTDESYLHDFSLWRRILALIVFAISSIAVYAGITYLGSKLGLPIAGETITLLAFLPCFYLFLIHFNYQFLLWFLLAIMLPSLLEHPGFPWNIPTDSTLINLVEFVFTIAAGVAARQITWLIVRLKLLHEYI